uniref:Uncharacterized protein n=1 Tax=Anguilla anguilla TaxID=7936 RepID=A0A0E9UEB8_ANGAN
MKKKKKRSISPPPECMVLKETF